MSYVIITDSSLCKGAITYVDIAKLISPEGFCN